MSLLKRAAAALSAFKKYPYPGYNTGAGIGTGLGWFGWNRPGSRHDWATEAGALELNSVVYSCVVWKAQQMMEADIVAQTRKGGVWKTTDGTDLDQLIELLDQPNEDYGWDMLGTALVASIDITGNAYLLKERSAARKVVRLHWVPSHFIGPDWPADQKEWVGYYRYVTGGGTFAVPPSEVVHLRAPLLNRNNVRLGQSPMESVLMDVCGDNGGGALLANIMARNGMPAALMVPDMQNAPQQGANSVNPWGLTAAVADEIKWKLQNHYAGDDRGKIGVLNVPLKKIDFDWKPNELGIGEARFGFEERICSVLGVPPVVVGLGAGLSKATAKASHEDSRKNAYEGTVKPMQVRLVRQLLHQLGPDFGVDKRKTRLWWDWSGVAALKEDDSKRIERLTKACGGPYLTVDEVREMEDRGPIEGGDVLRQSGGLEQKALDDAKDKGAQQEDDEDE